MHLKRLLHSTFIVPTAKTRPSLQTKPKNRILIFNWKPTGNVRVRLLTRSEHWHFGRLFFVQWHEEIFVLNIFWKSRNLFPKSQWSSVCSCWTECACRPTGWFWKWLALYSLLSDRSVQVDAKRSALCVGGYFECCRHGALQHTKYLLPFFKHEKWNCFKKSS